MASDLQSSLCDQFDGGYMKLLILVISALLAIHCSNKNFDTAQLNSTTENPVDEPLDLEDEDEVEEGEVCPRYDLIVKSTDKRIKRLNFKFTFNAEVKQNTTQGKSHVLFLQDDTTKYTQCSSEYTNTAFSVNLKPLKAVEALTAEVVLNHGRLCNMPLRTTVLQVVDSATSKVLWDEQDIIDQIGACEFGYTDEGNVLREQIISFTDQVVNTLADACNK